MIHGYGKSAFLVLMVTANFLDYHELHAMEPEDWRFLADLDVVDLFVSSITPAARTHGFEAISFEKKSSVPDSIDFEGMSVPQLLRGVPEHPQKAWNFDELRRYIGENIWQSCHASDILVQYGGLEKQPALIFDDIEEFMKTDFKWLLRLYLDAFAIDGRRCVCFFIVKRQVSDCACVIDELTTYGFSQGGTIICLPDGVALDDSTVIERWHAVVDNWIKNTYWYWWFSLGEGGGTVFIDDGP